MATYPCAAPSPLPPAATTAVNDVTLTNDGAWFTDSLEPRLYFVPVSQAGVPETTFHTLALSL